MKRLFRSDDKMVAGVCAGIAETYHLDVSIVRIGMAVGSVLTGFFPLVFIYMCAWAILPKKVY